MRKGQPRNIRQPIITKNPSTNRVIGDEPPFPRNSFLHRAMINAPSTSPMISGRTYCTAAALCSPSAPEVSRRKQAMQKPMLLGFPNSTSSEEITPMMHPAMTMVVFSFFISFFLSRYTFMRITQFICFVYPYPPENPLYFCLKSTIEFPFSTCYHGKQDKKDAVFSAKGSKRSLP